MKINNLDMYDNTPYTTEWSFTVNDPQPEILDIMSKAGDYTIEAGSSDTPTRAEWTFTVNDPHPEKLWLPNCKGTGAIMKPLEDEMLII